LASATVSITPASRNEHSAGMGLQYEPARAVLPSAISSNQVFEQAIDIYLEMRHTVPVAPLRSLGFSGVPGGVYAPVRNRRRRASLLASNTECSYAQYAQSLKLFFGGMTLEKIHVADIVGYQDARKNGAEPFIRFRRPQDARPRWVGDVEVPAKGKTSCPVKPKKVNQELGLLQMVMKHAGAWTAELDEHYALLVEEDEDEVPRALTPEEQEHWLLTAQACEDTQVIFWYSLVAFETLNSTDEMRGYRIGDWNLAQRVAIVRRGKVRARERTVQVTDPDALWAMERLLERAERCGATEYNHFIFPRRGRGPHGEWDPGQPMTVSGLKGPWNKVRERSGLTWFRPYDPRHTGITRLAEEGVPMEMIKQQAGHITDKMSRHYTHISEAARRRWMEVAHQSRWARRQTPLAQAERFVARIS
jgi:site-specific recombinase XerD